MDQQGDKFSQLYREVVKEEENNENLKTAGEAFREKQETYMTNLVKYLRSKCPDQFKWIDDNSEYKNGHFQLKDQNNSDEFNKKVAEMNQCIQTNANGYRKPLDDFDNEYQQFQQGVSKDLNECSKLSSQIEIKDCLRGKIKLETEKITKLFSKYGAMYDELKNDFKL